MDHIKDQRTGLINTTFILVGNPTGGGPGPWPLDPLNPALNVSLNDVFIPASNIVSLPGLIGSLDGPGLSYPLKNSTREHVLVASST